MTSKSQPSTEDLLKLMKDIIFPFLQVYRATPLRFAPGRYENDAEHSWTLALVACALAPHIDENLDVGKISQFATVHDLVEVHAGDTSNLGSEDEKATKDEREHLALQKLKTDLIAFPWICQTIDEYEEQSSDEAKFVRSVDKTLTLLSDVLEEGQLYKELTITQVEWQKKMQNHRSKASKHAGAFKYYDELWNLLLANPHYFHQDDSRALH